MLCPHAGRGQGQERWVTKEMDLVWQKRQKEKPWEDP